MNADTLATTALHVLDPKPHVPFNPDTQIQLDYWGCTITRNLKPTLREKLQLPALQQYYEDRMQWSSTTFDVIDWDIFRPVYRKQAKKNLQWVNKYCLQTLPTGQRLNKVDSCEATRCCSCGVGTEDDDHLFQCRARSTFLRSIRRKLKAYRDELEPNLYDLLVDGISTYVRGTILPFIRTCQQLSKKSKKTP